MDDIQFLRSPKLAVPVPLESSPRNSRERDNALGSNSVWAFIDQHHPLFLHQPNPVTRIKPTSHPRETTSAPAPAQAHPYLHLIIDDDSKQSDRGIITIRLSLPLKLNTSAWTHSLSFRFKVKSYYSIAYI